MKRLYTIIGILVAVVIIALVGNQLSQRSNSTKPTVGILQLMSHPSLNQIHKGVIDGLKEEGYVNGKNIKIDFQNAENDQSNLKSMAEKFKNENAKVTIGITTQAVQALANASSKTPIVMGAVSDPVGSGIVKSLKHTGNNVTGVQHVEPVAQQAKLIRTLLPNVKTIGVIYNAGDDAATGEVKLFQSLMEKQGITVKTYTITSTNDIDQVSANMASEVEAVYVPTDNTVAAGIQTLLKNTDSANVPVFGSVQSMIKSGAVATYSISQYDMGVLTGKMAGQILKGKKPSAMPVQHVKTGHYYINTTAAKKFNITIPQSILNSAKKDGVIYKWVLFFPLSVKVSSGGF